MHALCEPVRVVSDVTVVIHGICRQLHSPNKDQANQVCGGCVVCTCCRACGSYWARRPAREKAAIYAVVCLGIRVGTARR
jgi:hypothetical protein